ncbi:MAG: histidine kinase, partial [Christensenellaceae bacterium]
MTQTRATPDELLRRMEQQQRDKNRGKLKIFFGYAAGVGKTYAMLEAAHAAQMQGVDVVAGYIEPHTRPQTMKLLEGLEQIQPLLIPYKGITLREFDLDSAIRRHPQLILVDELAHTNAESCRHVKRYQDIEELLKEGIDVYTTVNVQHIESLNDIVASVTGVQVRERIPDHVFDDADQVELVDIEPEDLIKRLNDGKVYGKTQAERALGNFFTVENLISLREIALRRSADRVNRLAERAKQASAQGGHYTDEH